MKKKLALVIHSLDALLFDEGIKGGANRLNFELLNHLLERDDIELTLITQKSQRTDYKGFKQFIFFEGSIYTDRERVLAEIHAYAEAHPELTLLFSDLMAPFGNVLLQSHSLPHRRAGDFYGIRWLSTYLSRRKIKAQRQNFLGSARHFFTVSQTVKDDYVRHFNLDPSHVHVVYPGVLSTTLNPGVLSTTLNPSLSSYTPRVIGMVNSRSLNKGGLLFLSAVGILKALGVSFRVVMIHPYFQRDLLCQSLVILFRLNDCIKILPFQADMTSFYTQIDALVLPSLNEAFGLVTLEGMAQGVVPIVSSSAGVSELIVHGENGLRFERKAPVLWTLFQTLKTFLSLSERDVDRLKQNALKSSHTYTWHVFTEELIHVLFA